MKKILNKIVLWMLIVVLTFNTSLSYASEYTFSAGSNTVTKSQAENGFTFSVDTTGIYSVTVLPIIEDSAWGYSLSHDNKYMPLAALKSDTLKDKDGEPLYQIYSKSVPYFVLKAGTDYKMQIDSNILTNDEQFVTIKLGTPITNDTYYEATSGNALGEIEDNFQYLSYAGDTVSQAGVTAVDAASVLGGEARVNLVEQLLTSFFVKTLGDGAMFLIGVAAGETVTIDKIIFNEYSRTRLGFFTNDVYENGSPNPDKYNPFLSDSGLLPNGEDEGILNKFFNRFTYIAIVAYLIILLYMGIRIVLSSTGKGMARYKKLFFDWVLGVIILFLFPYVIRYTIKINDAVVSYIGNLRTKANVNIEEAEIVDYPGGLAFPFAYLGADASASQDYMSQMRTKALESGRIMYAICWFVMIKELVAFLFIYIKRLLVTLFLIVIFPLVTISYAVDKIGDGKSQAFNKWFSEYILNVFLQTFHAINYVVVMGLVFAIGKSGSDVNFILIIIGITYLAQGDKILRGIFSHMKGGGGGTVKDVAASVLATSGAMSVLKSSMSTIGGGFKKLGSINAKRLQKNDDVSRLQEYKAKQKWDEWNLSSSGISAGTKGANAENNISEDAAKLNVNIALRASATPEQLREALSKLRDYSNAGGDMKALYKNMNLTAGQQQQVDGLMEQNDAVDALQNVEILSEAEINANLKVLINNRKQKGNFAKLDRVLENQGVTHELQDKLAKAAKRRTIDSDDEKELASVRSSICTKADAKRLREIQTIDKEIVTVETKKQKATKLIASMEAGIRSGVYGDKTEEYKDKLKTARSKEFGYKQKLFELNEQKEKITAKMTNKNAKLSDTSYNKTDRVNHYFEVAKLSNGSGEITEEQKEIAEAQAIVDGSDAGEFTLSEIWEANKKITKARKTSTDNAVMSIIRNADSNPENKKTSSFTAQLAATVVNNEKALDGTSHDQKTIVSEAKKVIVEEAEDTPVYQHILDEAGFKINKDDFGKKTLEKLKKDDSVKEVVQDIVDAEETQLKEDIANNNKKITDDASYEKMKKKVFQERLDLTRETAKITSAAVTTPAIALSAAAMYSGAASELKPSMLIGAGKLGSSVASEVRDKTIDFAVNRVDNVTNVASGVISSVKNDGPIINNEKGLDVDKLATIADESVSTILYGDDNEKGVKTRNITLTVEKEPDKLTKEEEYRKKVLEERKAAIERMNKKIERFANGVENSGGTSSSNRNQRDNRRSTETSRNTTNQRRPLTQVDRNRQAFDRLNNSNNNNGNY